MLLKRFRLAFELRYATLMSVVLVTLPCLCGEVLGVRAIKPAQLAYTAVN